MRNVFFSLLLTLGAAHLAGADEPQFLIERLAVTGTHYVSPRIVISESRLREGAVYSEGELSAAMGRIERLPFVLIAEFSLQKGSAPGKYVLVMSIAETKPLFISARSFASLVTTDTPVVDRSRPGTDPPERRSTTIDYRNDYLTVGARWFIGARGVAHVAAEVQREDRYSLGYTQYGVFGTRASLTALVAYQNRHIGGLPGVFDKWRRTDDISYQVLATVPITGSQSIRGSWERATQPVPRIEPSIIPGSFSYRLEASAVGRREIGWIFDTTNDALFPTRGTLLNASASEYDYVLPADDGGVLRDRNSVLSLTAERYLPITQRQTISGGLDFYRRGLDEVRAHARYGVSLWDHRQTARYGDLRFETELDRTLLMGPSDERSAYSEARVGLAFRNAWGLVRLDFQYVGWRGQE